MALRRTGGLPGPPLALEIAGTEPARQWKTLRPEGGRQ